MKDINKVILVGRLGADPILRHTKKGISVAHFSLATSRRIYFQDPTISPGGETLSEESEEKGEKSSSQDAFEEDTQWHQIIAWSKQAEAVSKFLKKGDPVYVEGSLRSRSYENTAGEKRWAVEVYSEVVSFLSSASQSKRGVFVGGESDLDLH